MLFADVRHALRMFFGNPGFTLAVVAALALGIGADTAIFSVVNAVLLKPLTYPQPDRIVQFLLTYRGEHGNPGASATEFHVWQEQTSVFEDVAAYDFSSKGLNLTGGVPEQIKGVHVTQAYFRLFGARMLLLTIFGLAALVLAAIGIYGLMAYSVTQRVQEIGIRMALGADRQAIRRMVVWQGMRLALAGVVLGVGAAFGLTRLIASSLYGVKSWDPTAFVIVPMVLTLVALMATWIPAVRASRLDPMRALRIE